MTPAAVVVTTHVDGVTVDARHALRDELRRLHDLVGRPTYRALRTQAELAGHRLPISTAHDLLNGDQLPRWSTVQAFVLACIEVGRRRRPPVVLPAATLDLATWRHVVDSAAEEPELTAGSPAGSARRRPPADPTAWLAFAQSVNAAHGYLLDAAGCSPPERVDAIVRALRVEGIDRHREQLLAGASAATAAAGESLFQRLLGLADAVRAGTGPADPALRAAHARLADSLWAFRMTVREELGQAPLAAPGTATATRCCPDCGRPL